MTAHWKYLCLVLRHKWFVFVAGRRTGVSLWRLVIHDWTKFAPSEWCPYVHRFSSGRAGDFDKSADPDEWHRAWTHHWHRQPHHWEHWLAFGSDGVARPMLMPCRFVEEMVADWMGASRAYTGSWDVREWYAKNRERIVLHDESRAYAELVMVTS